MVARRGLGRLHGVILTLLALAVASGACGQRVLVAGTNVTATRAVTGRAATRPSLTRTGTTGVAIPLTPTPDWRPRGTAATTISVIGTVQRTATPTRVAMSAPAFGLIFAYGSCVTFTLDTFAGTLTRDIGSQGPPVAVPLVLTGEELERIRAAMLAIDFFGYPEHFAVSVPAGQTTVMVIPSMSYHFEVRDNGREKAVDWRDDIVQPTSAEADRLRELIQLITGIVAAKPESTMFPALTFGCA